MSEKESQSDAYNELLEKYNTLIKICQIVMHDVRSPLRFLADVAESLNSNPSNTENTVDRQRRQLLIETTNSLYLFTTNVLDWFVNNKIEISLNKEFINLPEVISEIIQVYEKSIQDKNNKLIITYSEDFFVYSNKEISSIIIRNAIDNANKYTKNGKIIIGLNKENNEIALSIKDTGRGFDHKNLLKNLHDSNPGITQHIGFRIIHDLAKQLGLKYELESEKGVGTLFVLRYPL